jgi:hypothetical protein
MRRLASLVAAFTATSFGCDSPTVCAEPPEFGVAAHVRDAVTSAPAAYGATLVVRDGSYADSVTGQYQGPDEQLALFLGAADGRPGTYDVSIRKDGYLTWSREHVVAAQGRCTVKGVTFDVRLSPTSP